MENIYTKFYGSDNYFQKKGQNNDAFYLSRSESVPSLSTNYHSKFPYNLPGTMPYRENENEVNRITKSDLKMRMLEEKIKKLEKDKKRILSNNYVFNPFSSSSNNEKVHLPLIYPNNYLNQRYNLLTKNANKGYRRTNRYYNMSQDMLDEEAEEEEDEDEKTKKKMKQQARNLYRRLRKEVYKPFQDDYNNYINNVNLNIQQKIENDNTLVNHSILEVQDDFNEVVKSLKDRLDEHEMMQNNNFERLKSTIQKVGGKKMDRAIKNVFEGAHYDLRKAADEDIFDDVFRSPQMIKLKMENQDRINKQMEKELRDEINYKVLMDLRQKREFEEMKHQEMVKKIKIKQEIERMENQRLLNQLQYRQMKEIQENKHDNKTVFNNLYNDVYNKANNFDFSVNGLFKMFLLKKLQESNVVPNGNGDNNQTDFKTMLANMLYNEMTGINNNNNNNINRKKKIRLKKKNNDNIINNIDDNNNENNNNNNNDNNDNTK